METILYCDSETTRVKAVISSLSQEFCVLCSTSLGELRENYEAKTPALVLIGCCSDFARTQAVVKSFRQFIRHRRNLSVEEAEGRNCPVAILDSGPTGAAFDQLQSSLAKEDGSLYFIHFDGDSELFLERISAVIRGLDGQQENADIFVGQSAAMRRVYKLIKTYANAKFPVLILGETGTGKELTAKALHNLSSRRREAFIARNCAAIPEGLIESELFGTEKGAFTDAVKRRGAFAMAERGTLFLDEIGCLSMSAQPHLLRVLESGEYWKLGGETMQRADFRLVSASCQSPITLAENEKFRPDLLYRIANLLIEIPPLRERLEDIRPLAQHFCAEASGSRVEISSGALDKLSSYRWPGNVRELKTTVTRAVIDCSCSRVDSDDIWFLHGKPRCC